MFWITENHFLFVGLFDMGNAETQTFSVSRNRDGFALAESRTRKSGTVAPLHATHFIPVEKMQQCFSQLSTAVNLTGYFTPHI